MKMLAFAVFDTKVGCFMAPFIMPTQGAAIRSFQDEVNKAGSDLNKHPEDFKLFQVGEYDEVKGCYVQGEYPVHLVNGIGVALVKEA